MPSLYQRIRQWQRKPSAPFRSGRLARPRTDLSDAPSERAASDVGELLPSALAQRFFESAPLSLFVADRAGRVLTCNRTFAALFGMHELPQPGALTLQSVCVEADCWQQLVSQLEGEPHVFGALPLRRADGRQERAIVILWWAPARNGASGDVHGTLLTSQARLSLEPLLGQAEQLEFLTRTAGELAHDFNNLLTIILSVSELMLATGKLSPPLARRARSVISASQRAASLTTQLLLLSRKPSMQAPAAPTGDVAREALSLLRRLTPELPLRVHIASNAGEIAADPAQLGQVLVNLVIHLRDALPPDRPLAIRVKRVRISGAQLRGDSVLRPGDYAELRVGQSGGDEAPPDLEQESELALGEAQRPTGLGLTSACGIVRQAGGHLEIERPPGAPPSFAIYLPLVERAEAPSAKTTMPRDTGDHTILVVEDEELVLQLTSMLLRELGYTVLEAADGVDALALARQHTGPIHLLLTDVTMPRMGGVELAREMRKLWPNLPVLYMSGHSEDTLLRQGLARREAHLLTKPFTQADLAQAVGSLLQQRQAAVQPVT